ncbi:O-methyltransferase [Eubacterium pyruvativorans]|uniref:O-methyltransferase n=1 Tax=Eubacterium pyruvativorans TaxID=155865 RepID=UPI001569B0BC|nr:O-methyltransferase [Eubacterium pyruvativorans]MDY4050084.1 O-methyltransferase [Eubacterium pyruvativorans]
MDLIDVRVTEFINGKYEAVDDRLLPFRRLGESARVPIILKETEQVLALLLELIRPSKILEIGGAIGYSASFFAWKCPGAHVWSAEYDENTFRAAERNIRRAGLSDRVHFRLGDGQEVTEKLRDEGLRDVDFVFLDASKSHYRRFLDAALTVCRPGALIVSDNIFQHGMTLSADFDPKDKHEANIRKMRDYVEYIFRDPQFTSALMAVGDGLAASVYHPKQEGGMERDGKRIQMIQKDSND